MKNLLNNLADVVQSDAIREGSLEVIVPEIYALKECIEINPWHDHQSVFDHTTASLAAFESYLYELSNSSAKHKLLFSKYLKTHVYGISHADLIRLALLFHDIAKPETLVVSTSDGSTACPHHELQGSLLTVSLSGAFGISHGTIRTISQLVLQHGTIHDVVNAAIRTRSEEVYSVFQTVVADLYIPLLLLSRCDAKGSDLQSINPTYLKGRCRSIDDAIEKFSLSLI